MVSDSTHHYFLFGAGETRLHFNPHVAHGAHTQRKNPQPPSHTQYTHAECQQNHHFSFSGNNEKSHHENPRNQCYHGTWGVRRRIIFVSLFSDKEDKSPSRPVTFRVRSRRRQSLLVLIWREISCALAPQCVIGLIRTIDIKKLIVV